MTRAGLGLVLIAMATDARKRAEYASKRRAHDAATTLHGLSFTLQAGAEECIRQAEEDRKQ